MVTSPGARINEKQRQNRGRYGVMSLNQLGLITCFGTSVLSPGAGFLRYVILG